MKIKQRGSHDNRENHHFKGGKKLSFSIYLYFGIGSKKVFIYFNQKNHEEMDKI